MLSVYSVYSVYCNHRVDLPLAPQLGPSPGPAAARMTALSLLLSLLSCLLVLSTSMARELQQDQGSKVKHGLRAFHSFMEVHGKSYTTR